MRMNQMKTSCSLLGGTNVEGKEKLLQNPEK
jgi:hypothetical protein